VEVSSARTPLTSDDDVGGADADRLEGDAVEGAGVEDVGHAGEGDPPLGLGFQDVDGQRASSSCWLSRFIAASAATL
jgi:hypothetical protein